MSEWVSKYVSLRKQVSRQGCKQANEQVNICHKNTMKQKILKKNYTCLLNSKIYNIINIYQHIFISMVVPLKLQFRI